MISVARNHPCPCGSGKKYKRCCGANEKSDSVVLTGGTPSKSDGAAFQSTTREEMEKRAQEMAEQAAQAAQNMPNMGAGGMAGGFDPSQMDPAMMAQINQALMRMPKGQLAKMQNLMQRAMSGQDVTQELMAMEKSLPPQLKALMAQANPMAGSMVAGMAASAADEAQVVEEVAPEVAADDLSVHEAKQIVEDALKRGEISKEEAEKLLANAEGGAGEAEQATSATADPELHSETKRKGGFLGLFKK